MKTVIEMAREAGFFLKEAEVYSPSTQEDHELTPYLERFASLVRAAERKQVALDKMADNARELGLDYAPIQCPVCKAEDSPYPKCGCVTYVEQPAQQEPVAYIRVSKTGNVMACAKTGDFYSLPDGTLLYTSPPAQRKPLTDEEIWREYQARWPFHPAEEPRLAADLVTFARAIEAAHGITENT